MIDNYKEATLSHFLNYCINRLGIQTPPEIEYINDRNWAKEIRAYGQYDPSNSSLKVYVNNRNLADVLRTFAHELVHHKQNELGIVGNSHAGKTGSPIENEANALAGVIMRDYGKINDLIYESNTPSLTQIYEIEKVKKIQIYCDMDGVLADFDARFEYYFDMKPRKFEDKYGEKVFNEKINEAGKQFWTGMKWMPEGKELWSVISKYNPILLTSPGKYVGAKEGKRLWVDKQISPSQKIIYKQAGNKHEILKGKSPEQIENSILIDDNDKNTNPWRESGAIGIYFKSTNQALKELKKHNIK
jgi:Zn-dependent peptidase ImmA (M78 family)